MSLLEWTFRSRALSGARAAERSLPHEQRTRLQRAQLAVQLADRVLDPVDPLPASGAGLALSLYRETAYWALLAQDSALSASSIAEAVAATPSERLVYAAGSEGELAQVTVALAEKDFVASANDEPTATERDARVARAFVHALIALQAGPAQRLRRLQVERVLRTALVLGTLLGAIVFGKIAIMRANAMPDLALGKKWRTSSTFAVCEPEAGRCAGARTDIFFHTNDEESPWFELDLGKPTKFAALEIDNRDDCCTDRPLPMIMEVSDNQRVWKQIARREEPFRTFHIAFTPVTARYLRLRVPRRTVFHLERVSVFER